MGIDLYACPMLNRPNGYIVDHDEWHLADNRLSILRDSELYAKIKDLNKVKLPKNVAFDWYSDTGVNLINEDAYGQALEYIEAGEFKKIKNYRNNKLNALVLKFLVSLPPKTPVVLYWH